MIFIKKSEPSSSILEILESEKTKTNGNYRHEEILNKLKEDFKDKCYICEYKKPTTLNVEHFVPHRGNIDLKFSWDNLFLSCSHCNNIKSDIYDDILNCTIESDKVEGFIEYKMEPYPKSKVKIIPLSDDCKVLKTVELLDKVYNGTTPLKRIESEYIREELLKELMSFQRSLYKYYIDDYDQEEKDNAQKNIIKHLKSSSAFAAFKRWIIRENEVFNREFGKYII